MKKRVRLRRPTAAAATAVALLAGLFTGAAGPAGAATSSTAAAPAMPSWLVPIQARDEADGTVKGCTAVILGPWRAATAPDCFTGFGEKDFLMSFSPDGGGTGTNNPRYRIHGQYDAATGRGNLAVAHLGRTDAPRPVLATAADGALYATGAKATYLSWTGATPTATRQAHSEQVVIKSAADCAVLLGRPLPVGSLCTAPAPGAPAVPETERCVGDAGGALMAGGKLIGLSATRATGCAPSGARLYTSVRAYRAQVVEWSRDIEVEYGLATGGVVARERRDEAFIDLCGNTPARTRDCAADDAADVVDFDLAYPLLTSLGDADGDGNGDLLARRTNGDLYRFDQQGLSNLRTASKTRLGANFGIYNRLLAPRDLSGDGYNDVVGRDSAGVLWLHRGTADGKLPSRTRIGSGWGQYTAIAGRGDYSGDGRSDLVARDSAGTLWLFRGNGAGGFSGATRIGGGWNAYNAVVGSGDIDADGRQDIVTRTPTGAAYVYNADGKGNFLPRKQWATTQWKNYLRIG